MIGAIKATSNNDILAILDARNLRYKVCRFGNSCSKQEIDQEISRLGLGLLHAVPFETRGTGLAIAIIPSALALRVPEFAAEIKAGPVTILEPLQIQERFPTGVFPIDGLRGLSTFVSPLVDRQRTVGFLCDSNTLAVMDTAEFRQTLGDASPIPVPTKSRYRAYATPGRKPHERCILGVSLESAEFYTPKLVAITDWIRSRYRQCTAMLGDGLYRLTLLLETDLLESDALEHSKWLARDFVHSQWPVFSRPESSFEFDFEFCSDVLTTHARYPVYYAQVRSLFDADPAFQASCRAFAHFFLRRKPQRDQNCAKNIDLSCRYLLEELAVISCLAHDGPCSFVYPGSLTILEEIAHGQHPGVPAPLLDIDYVELKLKHRDHREE